MKSIFKKYDSNDKLFLKCILFLAFFGIICCLI